MFGMVRDLRVSVLCDKSFTDRSIRRYFASERKLVLFNTSMITVITSHKTETNVRQEQEDEIIAISVAEKDFNQGQVRVALTVTLTPLSESSVLFATSVRVVVRINACTQVQRNYSCQVAHAVMNAFLKSLFHVTVTNASTSVFKLLNEQCVGTTTPTASEMLRN